MDFSIMKTALERAGIAASHSSENLRAKRDAKRAVDRLKGQRNKAIAALHVAKRRKKAVKPIRAKLAEINASLRSAQERLLSVAQSC